MQSILNVEPNIANIFTVSVNTPNKSNQLFSLEVWKLILSFTPHDGETVQGLEGTSRALKQAILKPSTWDTLCATITPVAEDYFRALINKQANARMKSMLYHKLYVQRRKGQENFAHRYNNLPSMSGAIQAKKEGESGKAIFFLRHGRTTKVIYHGHSGERTLEIWDRNKKLVAQIEISYPPESIYEGMDGTLRLRYLTKHNGMTEIDVFPSIQEWIAKMPESLKAITNKEAEGKNDS